METNTDQQKKAAEDVIREIVTKCSGPFIAREKIGEVTGDAVSPRYMANLDSRGEGVPGAFYVGRKKVYPVTNLVDWLIARLHF